MIFMQKYNHPFQEVHAIKTQFNLSSSNQFDRNYRKMVKERNPIESKNNAKAISRKPNYFILSAVMARIFRIGGPTLVSKIFIFSSSKIKFSLTKLRIAVWTCL